MQCTIQDLEEDFQALHTARTLSLDDTGGGSEEDSSSLASALADESIADPGEGASARERVELLTKAIAELPETERHVVVLYYHERLFLKEIGQVLNVTESRVSQILTRATERLRLKLGAEAPV
jgi:RNA polymerase sigma factor for flagellar operon FliA